MKVLSIMIQDFKVLPIPSGLVKNGVAHQVGGAEDTQKFSS